MNDIRIAREFCFQYLFHLQLPVFESLRIEYTETQDDAELMDSIRQFKESTNSIFSDSSNKYIEASIKGTIENYPKIEEIIERNLKNWKLGRLSKVDHTNLLLAVNELCYNTQAPTSVVINEAIEISKKFGTLESSAFVNGVLDNIAKNEK